MPENKAGLYWFLQKKCPCAVPTGLQGEIVQFRFPTLKRGANEFAAANASGAIARKLLLQCSLAPEGLPDEEWASSDFPRLRDPYFASCTFAGIFRNSSCGIARGIMRAIRI